MIKTIRRIRKKLIFGNKAVSPVARYLFYALGEIILVVIGILIALQINNWNENNKKSIEEINLLKALNSDFSENKQRINETMNLQANMIDYSYALIKVMSNPEYLISTDSIIKLVGNGAGSWWRAEHVTGTYEAIIGSGNINYIRNRDLKRLLASFSAESGFGFEDHEESKELLFQMNVERREFGADFLFDDEYEEFGLLKNQESINLSVQKLLRNKVYFSLLIEKTALEKDRLEYQKKMYTYTEEILSIIESELSGH